MADYLLATPHGFYFRMKVPPDLRIRLGKRELKKALNTADKKRARLVALLYAARATEIFDLMRFFTVDLYPFPVETGVPANGCGLLRPLK
jgi:hypothetical protein